METRDRCLISIAEGTHSITQAEAHTQSSALLAVVSQVTAAL